MQTAEHYILERKKRSEYNAKSFLNTEVSPAIDQIFLENGFTTELSIYLPDIIKDDDVALKYIEDKLKEKGYDVRVTTEKFMKMFPSSCRLLFISIPKDKQCTSQPIQKS